MKAMGKFEIASWDESPYEEFDGGRKLAKASVTERMSGDVEAEAQTTLLLCYAEDGTASFVGLQRVVGRVGDREGSFVLQHAGTYAGGVARSRSRVVEGSSTGDLRGLRGSGGYEATHEGAQFTLDYELG